MRERGGSRSDVREGGRSESGSEVREGGREGGGIGSEVSE